jgi:MarR family transcriptional regulator, organic hydroperoxide resistance regulator
LVEQLTLNQRVPGSSPGAPTKLFKRLIVFDWLQILAVHSIGYSFALVSSSAPPPLRFDSLNLGNWETPACNCRRLGTSFATGASRHGRSWQGRVLAITKQKSTGKKRNDDARSVGIEALVVGGDERAFRDFMSDIFAAASTMQTLRRSTAKLFGLSSTELAVIMTVAKINSNPSIRRIADHLHVSASNVTADVGRLVRARLLKKNPDPEDARAIKVAMTDKGIELVREMAPALRSVNDRLFANMSKSYMAALARLLKQIIAEGGKMAMSD